MLHFRDIVKTDLLHINNVAFVFKEFCEKNLKARCINLIVWEYLAVNGFDCCSLVAQSGGISIVEEKTRIHWNKKKKTKMPSSHHTPKEFWKLQVQYL